MWIYPTNMREVVLAVLCVLILWGIIVLLEPRKAIMKNFKNQHGIEFCVVYENNVKSVQVKTVNGWHRIDVDFQDIRDLNKVQHIERTKENGVVLLKAVS